MTYDYQLSKKSLTIAIGKFPVFTFTFSTGFLITIFIQIYAFSADLIFVICDFAIPLIMICKNITN